MSDFEWILESVFNERFIDESTLYYDNPFVAKEIEDIELGLNGEFVKDDIRNLLKYKNDHGSETKIVRYTARAGTRYDDTDDLSIYKTRPSGLKPALWNY